MIRPLMLVALAGILSAAMQPETLDLRAKNEALGDVLDSIAKQCDAGLVVHQVVQERMAGKITLTARKATWAESSRWLADEHRLTMRLVGEHLEIGDADREFRARLVTVLYDVRILSVPMATFPGPDLDIPEPGGFGSHLAPPIEAKSIPAVNEFIEILQRQIAPNSWEIEGVAIEDYNGSLVVAQVPEVHSEIVKFISTLERASARQLVFRLFPLPAAPPSTVIDRATWSELAKGIGAPVGVVQMLDEQRANHFSGTQRAAIVDLDVNQELFDPIVSVISDGLTVDLQAHVTHAGVVTTTRFSAVTKQTFTASDLVRPNALPLPIATIDLVARDQIGSRDTRVIPDGGAALYRFGDQVYALSVEVLDFTKKP